MDIAISVGASLLSAAISKILDTKVSSEFLKFARKEKVEAEIREWHTQLSRINAVLVDAEQKHIDDERVKLWLRELKDVVYDAEDVLDEFNYEALRCKLTAKTEATTSKVRALLASCCTSLSPSIVFSNVKIGSKLEEITARLEDIAKAKHGLGLIENVGGKSKRIAKRRSTAPLVDVSVVYGREDDKEKIVELLLGGEAGADLGVVPIVGMGGLGKTTLAQLAYNDDRVNACFDLKAWVCVSDDFDIFKITKTVWQYITSESCQIDDEGLLQQKLKEKLHGKKFLIVLDDVWNENVAQWEDLCKPFKTGERGCKLVVTTRNDGVVSTTSAISTYRLRQLSDDACLSILEEHALRKFDKFPELKEIGREICSKCGGMPLAVKTLGGLLRNKQNPEEWEAILKSDMWDLPEKNNDILPALRLSYHHLPAVLKCCFVYCSLFPKDYEFEKNQLVSLWMAEGFLHQLKGKKEMEDLGCEYFDELLSRSFFQQSNVNETTYVMHDLMNDLAKVVAKQEKVYFCLDDEMQLCEEYNVCGEFRHSSFIVSSYDVEKRFKGFSNVKQLRTFLALEKGDKIYGSRDYCLGRYLSRNVVYDMLPEFKLLRALSLCPYAITMLPNSIGDLKLLRYLNLSYCWITRLPDSVEALYNLQTLILYGCWNLTELPVGIKNLIELHNLDIKGTRRLQEMPSGIGTLTKLRTLSKFIVGEGDKLHIQELKELMHLQGRLSIYGLDKVKDIQDVKIANLKGKHRLDKLSLVWSNVFRDSRNEQDEKHVLNLLKPSQNLKVLKIKSYGGKDFPAWLGDSLFAMMVRITLVDCKKCKELPSLGGMPSLKHLHIQGMDKVERVGHQFYGGGESLSNKPFHNLETLTFMDMLGWVEWTSQNVEEFSRLRKLVIGDCPNLTGNLPSHFPSLEELEVSKCPQLKSSRTMSLPSLVKMTVNKCDAMFIRSMVNLNCLTTAVMKKISGLSYLDRGLMKSLATVVDLEIESCNELKYLWQNGEQPGKLPCVGSEEPDTYGLKFLKKLAILSCEALEMLPDCLMLQGSNNDQCVVEELSIESCPLIRSFPRGSLSTTLKRLSISNCENLKCLPLMMHDDGNGNISCGLQVLYIYKCGSLESFPPGKFPATLEGFYLYDCWELESLAEGGFQDNTMLKEICIRNYPNLSSLLPFGLGLGFGHLTYLAELSLCECRGLVSFPENVFLSTPNLKILKIRGCRNLKSLPNQMHKNLTSLRTLIIAECPDILFLCFPEEEEGCLPPNLILLHIKECENMEQPMSKWGLDELTSLEVLRIGGPCSGLDEIVSFPDDECLTLPTSLTTLSISGFKNMESLSRGLLNLTSLQRLFILHCPKLRSLAKEGCLPDSLGSFKIDNCKLLGERCIKEKKGDYWPLIAHIPFINISHEEEKLTYTAGEYADIRLL